MTGPESELEVGDRVFHYCQPARHGTVTWIHWAWVEVRWDDAKPRTWREGDSEFPDALRRVDVVSRLATLRPAPSRLVRLLRLAGLA